MDRDITLHGSPKYLLYHDKIEFTPTALLFHQRLSFEDWSDLGHVLRKMDSGIQWWWGDWCNEGEKAYGEKYTQALEESDYTIRTLHQYAYIARNVESSTRVELLPHKHHELVAPLPPDEQRRWLQRALQGNDGKPWSVATLRAAIKDSKNDGNEPDWLKRTDVWNIPSCDDRYGIDYPGRIPGQIVLNVLYYYTNEGDLVVDPMAGGGVTIDACKAYGRRCFAFDVMSSRDDIVQADATKEWPLDELADLVFIDPPYWSQMESDYGGMASKPYNEYLADMQAIFINTYHALNHTGVLAVLIAPVAIQQDYIDIPFDFKEICEGIGFKLIRRINVPVSSQQVGPQVVKHCKDNDIMVALIRDLLVFEASAARPRRRGRGA